AQNAGRAAHRRIASSSARASPSEPGRSSMLAGLATARLQGGSASDGAGVASRPVSRPTDDAERLAAARRGLLARGVGVLYEDHLLLFVSKAAGVLSQRGPKGEDSLVERVDAYRRAAEGKAGRA